MRSASICLAMIGSACLRQPDFTSANGVEYRFETDHPWMPWSPEDINLVEDGLIARVSQIPGYNQDATRTSLRKVQVFIYPSQFRCISSPSGWCNGQEDYQELSVVDMGTPQNSALAHEMIHWLQYDLHGVTDYDHESNDGIWSAQ